MAYKQVQGNYVKFLRGTPAAWQSIETKDSDTLYFIAEDGANRGELYLGNKLISSGVSNSISLTDLRDVLYSANISDNSILIYDANDEMWEPTSLETVLSQIVQVMTGATAQDNGLSGLVPRPLAGQQGLFLKGDGTWADPTASLRQTVENTFSDLYGSDQTGQSIRDIASSLIDDLVGNAPASLDTLEELATWVNNHEQVLDITQAAQDIEQLTQSMFGTLANPAETDAQLVQMVQQDGVIRILTDLNTIVLGDGNTIGLQSKVNTLENQVSDNTAAIASLNASMTSITTRVTNVEGRLRWTDVVEDNE